MKVLIANAIWGKAYCSTFCEYSLATLLSPNNIPALAQSATIVFHICTTRRDRRRLLRHPAVAELQRHCAIEWELVEDFGIVEPPTGPSGEKYPFLSALQNIAIARSADLDAIVFNYADFVWTDGSLSSAIAMLERGGARIDAVFSFCLPVDRNLGVGALERLRQAARPVVIELKPHDGARIAVECIHREAKLRFWEEAPRFTNLPSYLIWRAGEYGILVRAYHQSILAMRIRRGDPRLGHGIRRGSLDSSFGAELSKSPALAFATDSDRVLVFSLYDTIVDSRVPPGVTREMSLRDLLRQDVTPEQRALARRPIFIRMREGGEALWREVAERSGEMLRHAEAATAFDQAAYDERLATHGVVPRLARLEPFARLVVMNVRRMLRAIGPSPAARSRLRQLMERARRLWPVLWNPLRLYAAIRWRLEAIPAARWIPRLVSLVFHPSRIRGAVERRLARILGPTAALRLGLRPGIRVAPRIWIEHSTDALFSQAVEVEDAVSKGTHSGPALREAERLLRQAIKEAPVWIEPVRALGRNLWFQARFDEAMRTFAEAERLRDAMARTAWMPVDSCVFLPRNCAQVIGLMGHIDAFVKYRILTADPRPYYLIAPRNEIVNPAFLEYWRDYITIVSRPEEIAKRAPLERIYAVNWNWAVPRNGDMVFVHEGLAAIHKAWHEAGRAPLLRLRADHAEALRAARAKWGMAEGDRFICLHVRSRGFYGGAREVPERFRNTTIDSYYPMIRAVTEKGLWVIRMGDASMPPLDRAQCGSSGRTVDYALSAEKRPELDVALCAQCELFVSSPSGLHTVAHAFGRRVCEVNYPIYPGFPWHPDDIFIPQLYYSHTLGRTLTLEEILGSDLVHRDHQFLLDAAGTSLIPNDPSDIAETVLEALSPAAYRVEDEASAERVCAAFDELNRRHNRSISGRLGRYFADKYAADLVPTRSRPPAKSVEVAPNIIVDAGANAIYAEAISVEDSASRATDNERLHAELCRAEQLLRRTIKSSPLWIDPVRALGRNLWFQSRFDEAIQTFASAERLRNEMARAAGWPVDSCVFLPRNCAQVIGLMGHIDAFVKHKILTGDSRSYYLLAPPHDVVNGAFLDYWRDYITVVSQPEEIAKLAPLEPVYSVNWNWIMPKDGTTVFVHEGIAAIQRAWQQTGRGPLLQLHHDHADALHRACKKWGMKEGDRFICLHVRSVGFRGESREKSQRFRNIPIDTYYPLIRSLTEMGYWVIRMGDASMPPLNLAQCGDSGRIVDYALSSDKCAELDVALCARCELIVATNSGLHTLAHSFGRPVCGTNHAIYSGVPWHPGDIFIPQRYYSHTKGRVLTLWEILATDVVHCDHHFLFEQAGISLLPNDADDIVETVREALAPSTYQVENAALADKVCAAFNEFNRQYDRGISGRLGRYFAMKYAEQLLPAEQHLQIPGRITADVHSRVR